MRTFFDGISPCLLAQRNVILNGTDDEFSQLDLSSTWPSVCKDDGFEDLLKALF